MELATPGPGLTYHLPRPSVGVAGSSSTWSRCASRLTGGRRASHVEAYARTRSDVARAVHDRSEDPSRAVRWDPTEVTVSVRDLDPGRPKASAVHDPRAPGHTGPRGGVDAPDRGVEARVSRPTGDVEVGLLGLVDVAAPGGGAGQFGQDVPDHDRSCGWKPPRTPDGYTCGLIASAVPDR